jgi:hypothetical protein
MYETSCQVLVSSFDHENFFKNSENLHPGESRGPELLFFLDSGACAGGLVRSSPE